MSTSTRGDGVADAIVNARLYGIHHPKNLHSFNYAYYVFIPSPCVVCNKPVIPFVQACSCLRCKCLAHRSCAARAPKCAYFTFNDWKELPPDEGENKNSSSSLTVDDIIHKAILIPKVLGYIPEPGSELCIWRCILRAIARCSHLVAARAVSDFAALDSKSDDKKESLGVAAVKILEEHGSFANVVCNICHSVFLALSFQGSSETLRHGRECLDTVICALLSAFSPEKTSDDQVLQVICQASDQYMLDMEFGIMYEKLFKVCIVSSAPQHRQLFGASSKAPILTGCRRKIFQEVTNKALDAAAMKLCRARSALEKLQCLVGLLQLLVSPPAGEYDLCDAPLHRSSSDDCTSNSPVPTYASGLVPKTDACSLDGTISARSAAIGVGISVENEAGCLTGETFDAINGSIATQSVVSLRPMADSSDYQHVEPHHSQSPPAANPERSKADSSDYQHVRPHHSQSSLRLSASYEEVVNPSSTDASGRDVHCFDSGVIVAGEKMKDSRQIPRNLNDSGVLVDPASFVAHRALETAAVENEGNVSLVSVFGSSTGKGAGASVGELSFEKAEEVWDVDKDVEGSDGYESCDGDINYDSGGGFDDEDDGVDDDDGDYQEEEESDGENVAQACARPKRSRWVDVESPTAAVICEDEDAENIDAAASADGVITGAISDCAAHQSTSTKSSAPVRSSAPDTDGLLWLFSALILRQIREQKVQWTAESAYMMSSLLRDPANLIGPEGYALASLQQCMEVLLSSTTSA